MLILILIQILVLMLIVTLAAFVYCMLTVIGHVFNLMYMISAGSQKDLARKYCISFHHWGK